MHLKQLKLAGFKSFVDPMVVYFPSQLVAVVGPNGCGKSNIIDAVRWVLGESSAKNLRGESMTDVIFNGSSHRKSLGQASVELMFDNSLGRLTGAFSSYGEIAVKRLVTRDGDSFYYLNGSRCRRKDITDIFLGTGAGARGYSIIGQGTISQLIEAKPEDLRIYLEEAAGVSKYKERRRETLQRIEYTRENLTRVADIREELDKQLQRLERQAKAAERYLLLKNDEKLCRAEILALKWQDFITQAEIKQRQIQDLTIRYEEQQSILVKINKERNLLQETHFEVDQQTQQVQTHFYQLGTEIARLEEMIQQQAREKQRLQHERQQMQEDGQLAEEQLKKDQEELFICHQYAQNLEQQLELLRMQFKELELIWQDTQKQQAEYEFYCQQVQTNSSNLQKEWEVTRLKAQHLEEKRQHTFTRLEKLQLETKNISINDLQQVQYKLEEQRVELIAEQETAGLQFNQCQQDVALLRNTLKDIEKQLHVLQDDYHLKHSEYAALVAVQNSAIPSIKQKNTQTECLENPRLMEILQIESKWQFACERVLNEMLHAYVFENNNELEQKRTICEVQCDNMITLQKRKVQSTHLPRLVDKIRGDIPAHIYPLEYIYLAEHSNEALNFLSKLGAHESIITAEGVWLGHGWIKFVIPEEQDEIGLLSRQQKIAELSIIVQRSQQQIDLLKADRDRSYQQLEKSLKDSELRQEQVNIIKEAVNENTICLNTNHQAIQLAEKRMGDLAFECETLKLLLEETTTEQYNINEKVLMVEKQSQVNQEQLNDCLSKKEEGSQLLAIRNKQLDEVRIELHRLELEYDRQINIKKQLHNRIEREQERLTVLQERLQKVNSLCLHIHEPEAKHKEQLAQQLQKHAEIELQLSMYREQLSDFRIKLEEGEKNILNCDLKVKDLQEEIAQARIEEQALTVRASSIEESLHELSMQAQALLEIMHSGVTQAIRENDLIELLEKIKRLGAINLAAIEEFTTEQQRKIYLDEQHQDLSEALLTLEAAIEKMDQETRSRLENTFDEVNTSFKTLFPRLFGGGRAQLELTCDNLLEAGIVVMAQPPGKRNSTIHLLSGGEKAMTAIALVFAIFQLNPSPFCMLDEVDAPLDDVNVGRFCTLVKEMSQFVQFLFITHNKVTMKLADHLIGVTMREPGVSRLVAVDVTQALAME